MAKKDNETFLWFAGIAAVAGLGAYVLSQKGGGFDFLNPRDSANKDIAPKPCGCGMEKTNHSDSQ